MEFGKFTRPSKKSHFSEQFYSAICFIALGSGNHKTSNDNLTTMLRVRALIKKAFLIAPISSSLGHLYQNIVGKKL